MSGNLSTSTGRDSAGGASNMLADEACLVSRIHSGDEQAFELLVRVYSSQLLALARRYLRCESDAADAVQDAFLSAFRAFGSFEANSSLGTWLHRIVVNVCLMKLRARSRRPTVPLDDLLPSFDETGHHTAPVKRWSNDVHHRLAIAETRSQVRSCIDRLPEDYRTILLLRDIEEFDTEQTANMLGLSPAAVKTRLHRARQALRSLLEPVFCIE